MRSLILASSLFFTVASAAPEIYVPSGGVDAWDFKVEPFKVKKSKLWEDFSPILDWHSTLSDIAEPKPYAMDIATVSKNIIFLDDYPPLELKNKRIPTSFRSVRSLQKHYNGTLKAYTSKNYRIYETGNSHITSYSNVSASSISTTMIAALCIALCAIHRRKNIRNIITLLS